jgi:hypothetical protein
VAGALCWPCRVGLSARVAPWLVSLGASLKRYRRLGSHSPWWVPLQLAGGYPAPIACPDPVAIGRPTSLTPEMIPIAAEVARDCASYQAIARAIGVHPTTVRKWLQRGDEHDAPPLFQQFSQVIHAALIDAESALTKKLQDGDGRDAAWLLTHSPFFRDEWSDAAAERRAVRRAMAGVVTAIDGAGLTDDQRMRLLLSIQAQGIGVPAEEQG